MVIFRALFRWLWGWLWGLASRRKRVRKSRRARPGDAAEYAAFVARHCGEKIKHSSDPAARDHARELQAKTGEAFSTYRCKVCGAFHVGHRRR